MEPFVKWAGGKRQLLKEIEKRLPNKFNKYYEPFVGGGALLFYLSPDEAVINDINKELINTYLQIRTNPEDLIVELNKMDNIEINQEDYNIIRERYNEKIIKAEYDMEMAVLFIYLNKHCFNGLYRVNRKGLFNVPWNKKSKVSSFNKSNIMEISTYLKDVNILNGDFSEALKDCEKGDFIFIDSPYAPINPTSFESYTKEGFDKDSHIRLSEEFKRLDELGCYCMLTNHNTEFIKELYKDYNVDIVNVKRMINSDSKNRVGKEVIITNYDY